MFRSTPLFLILLIIYNALMLMGDLTSLLGQTLFSVGLMSGAVWTFNVHDAFVIGGVLILYFEIIKATRTGMSSLLDHTLSMLVFVAFLVEFLVVKGAGTSTFFALTLMSLLDVIAGFTVSIVAARRDVAFPSDS
mgnify:CR=1 FL=1